MNLKYYLRGLGLGIVMTAIVMAITTSGKKEVLTEEEITVRALGLGMIEEEELEKQLEKTRAETEARIREELAAEYGMAGPGSAGQGTGAGNGGPQASDEKAGGMADLADGNGADGTDPEEDVSSRRQEEDSEPDETDRKQEEPIIFNVKKGESPYSIGQRMEEDGLLPKDAQFDKYMVDNGYDTKIVAAEYEIPADADMETIAKIITKQN